MMSEKSNLVRSDATGSRSFDTALSYENERHPRMRIDAGLSSKTIREIAQILGYGKSKDRPALPLLKFFGSKSQDPSALNRQRDEVYAFMARRARRAKYEVLKDGSFGEEGLYAYEGRLLRLSDTIDRSTIFFTFGPVNDMVSSDVADEFVNQGRPIANYYKTSVEEDKTLVSLLADFGRTHGLSPKQIFESAKELVGLPQNSASQLPDKAPALYRDRAAGENIIDFLRKAWKPWIDRGELTRPHLLHTDPQAYAALAQWLRKNTLPPDLKLPKKSELVSAEVMDTRAVREAHRLASAAGRRSRSPA